MDNLRKGDRTVKIRVHKAYFWHWGFRVDRYVEGWVASIDLGRCHIIFGRKWRTKTL